MKIAEKNRTINRIQFKKTRENIRLNNVSIEMTGNTNNYSIWSAWLDQRSEFKSIHASNTSVKNINFPIKWWEN